MGARGEALPRGSWPLGGPDGRDPALLDTGSREHLPGSRPFHVPLEVINEALHLLHGGFVPGEAADALADTFKSSSVAASCRSSGGGSILLAAITGAEWPADVGCRKQTFLLTPSSLGLHLGVRGRGAVSDACI